VPVPAVEEEEEEEEDFPGLPGAEAAPGTLEANHLGWKLVRA